MKRVLLLNISPIDIQQYAGIVDDIIGTQKADIRIANLNASLAGHTFRSFQKESYSQFRQPCNRRSLISEQFFPGESREVEDLDELMKWVKDDKIELVIINILRTAYLRNENLAHLIDLLKEETSAHVLLYFL